MVRPCRRRRGCGLRVTKEHRVGGTNAVLARRRAEVSGERQALVLDEGAGQAREIGGDGGGQCAHQRRRVRRRRDARSPRPAPAISSPCRPANHVDPCNPLRLRTSAEPPAADERDGGSPAMRSSSAWRCCGSQTACGIGVELAQRPVEVEQEEQVAGAPPRVDGVRREPDVSRGHSTRCSRAA